MNRVQLFSQYQCNLNLREQQGLSSGHWLLELQVVVAKAVADRARSAVAKRTIVSKLYTGDGVKGGEYPKSKQNVQERGGERRIEESKPQTNERTVVKPGIGIPKNEWS